MRSKEIKCDGCHMEATSDRLDTGVTDQGEVVYIYPVCGHNMGEVVLDVNLIISKFNHPSGREQ